jgi:hypothetical protein
VGEGRDTKEDDGWVNTTKVHCIHVWKCYNEDHYFAQLIYTKKKKYGFGEKKTSKKRKGKLFSSVYTFCFVYFLYFPLLST